MIRKQTWILLVVFVVLAGLAFYLQRNPFQNSENITPSPTSQSFMINGWSSNEIARIEYQDNQGSILLLEELANGGWVLKPEDAPVNLGKIEELRTQILDATTLAFLNSEISLDAVGLVKPTGILSLESQDGKKSTVRIGSLTPTESGYYMIVDEKSPIVVSRFAVESFLEMLVKERLLDYTPTPELLDSLEETPQP